jgi:uncharacterized protein involved in exopolysaccharide biosynthesis
VYARALYRLEELRGAPARLAIAATGGSLLQRVRRLVNGAPEAWPVTAREFGGLTLLAIGCVLLLTGACLMFGPESYSGTVRIRVERERPVYSPGSAPGVTGSYDPYFIQTEFEVLQSQLILGKVIADLDLNREWGKRLHMVLKTEDTIELLKRQLDLRPVRNTSIIEIRVQDEDPAEAAEVANAIARVYTDYRAGKQENGSGKGAGSLVTQMKEQDALAAQAQAKVDALRKQLNLSEASSTDSSPSLLLSAETLRRVEALRLESQAEYIRTRSLLEAFRKLPLEDLIQALPTTGIQDVNLNELVAQRNLIEQRLVATEKEFGPQYSEVVKLKAQAEDLRRKVKYRAEGILGGLDARVSSLRQGLDDLNKEIANALQSEQQTAAASRPYLDAQRELEERQRFRQMLALKIAEEKTDLQLPRNSPVEIVDPAHASTRPSSPNRPRAVGLMVSGLFLCLVGLLLARSGRNQAMELASS